MYLPTLPTATVQVIVGSFVKRNLQVTRADVSSCSAVRPSDAVEVEVCHTGKILEPSVAY